LLKSTNFTLRGDRLDFFDSTLGLEILGDEFVGCLRDGEG
jgi:hypothetical protein